MRLMRRGIVVLLAAMAWSSAAFAACAPFIALVPANNLSDVCSASASLAFLQGLPLTGGTLTGALHMGANLIDGSDIAFTGGSLNSVTVGLTTPAAGAFTTLSASGSITALTGSAAGIELEYTAGAPTIAAILGSNTGLTFLGTGDGLHLFRNAEGNLLLIKQQGSSAVANYFETVAEPTGSNAILGLGNGSDSNGGITIQTNGSGVLRAPEELQPNTLAILQATAYPATGSAAGAVPLFISTSVTGTPTSGVGALAYLGVATDTAACALVANGCDDMLIQANFGGSGVTGARAGIRSVLTLTAPTGNTTPGSGQYVSAEFWIAAQTPDNGTAPTAGLFRSELFAENLEVVLQNGAINWAGAGDAEDDIAWQSGSSGGYKYGLSIVQLASDAVHGSVSDTGLVFGNQNGASAPWQFDISFGQPNASAPYNASSTLIGVQPSVAGPPNSANPVGDLVTNLGMDLSPIRFVTGSLRLPGLLVNQTGGIASANGFLGPSASGMQLDIPDEIVSAVVVAAAGAGGLVAYSNYRPGDPLVDAAGGLEKVTTTKVVGLPTVVAAGSGGSPSSGTCTVTGTTGVGTPMQAGVTLTGGAISAVNSLSVAGSYTTNPNVNPAAEPVTGCGSLSGATLLLNTGLGTVSIVTPAVAPAGSLPSNPVSVVGGGATGGELTLTFSVENTLALSPSGGPTTIGGALTVVGGITSGSSAGLSCSGTPSSSFRSTNGIVTHC